MRGCAGLIVAVVVRDAVPLTTLCVFPFTNPVIVALNVGFAAPYARLAFCAVTVSGALVTVCVRLPDILPL